MDIGYAGSFIGGILSLLSPCSVMLLPAFFAYAFVSPSKLIARTGLFYLGLISTLVPLGIFSATLGSLVTGHRGTLVIVAAMLVIAAGSVQLLGIPIPGLTRTENIDSTTDRTSAVSVYFLGAVYAVAGVCAGPILGSVLMVSALGGNPVYGGIMLALYALGMAVPLFVLAAVWRKVGSRGRAWLRPRTLRIGRWQNSWILVISGLLSIGVGVLLVITNGTASVGGFFSIGTQYAAESWVSTTVSDASNVWFVLGGFVLLAATISGYLIRNRRHQDAGDEENERPATAGMTTPSPGTPEPADRRTVRAGYGRRDSR